MTIRPKIGKLIRLICFVLLSASTMGFTMCSRNSSNEAEALKRSQSACIQMMRAFFPEKDQIIRTTELAVEALASNEKYKNLQKDWAEVKLNAFIEKGVDEKIQNLVASTTLSPDQLNAELVKAVQDTLFWKNECSGTVKNELLRCADKFKFDSADYTNCLSTSSLNNNDYVGTWSPFYREFQKRIRPILKEAYPGG